MAFHTSITDVAKVEKIVDYAFEKNEKSNVLAIHPTRPLIAYLINIQRTQKISKAWSSGNDSPSSSLVNGEKNKTVSIRIIDYVTRQRCLAKGIYHARPADCVFTINSLICSQTDTIKLAIVDRLANVYLYDLSCLASELTATRIAVIRGPAQETSPYEAISLVWCPFVPCEDFDDGDGGLRLALTTNSRIEIFAIDRIQGKTGEIQRSELKGAYKCIIDGHKTDIVTLSISPDCSTISAAALDNQVTFFSSDIDDGGQRCLHNWEASITDKSSVSKLFFLDDYPKLLEDSTMKFWGAAFIGTRSGQVLLVDLRTWSVYQQMSIEPDASAPRNFDYRIDLTSRNVIAMNGNQCFVIQIEHDRGKLSSLASNIALGNNQNELASLEHSINDMMNGNIFNYLSSATAKGRFNQQKQATKKLSSASNNSSTFEMNGLPRIVRTTKLGLHNPIYSFVIKHRSDDAIELFTISAYSLERYTINLGAINSQNVEDMPISTAEESRPNANAPPELTRFLQQFDGSLRISSSGSAPNNTPNNDSILLNASVTSTATPMKQTDVLNLMILQSACKGATTTPTPAPPTTAASITTSKNTVNNNSNIDNIINAPLPKNANVDLDVGQIDRVVEALFTKLNTAFSQGLDEFLNDVKCEVNDLKLKLNGLCRDVRKLQQQLQDTRQK